MSKRTWTTWDGKPVDFVPQPIDERLDALIRKGDVYLMPRDRKETEKRAHELYRKGCRDLALAAMEGAKLLAETPNKGGRPRETDTPTAAATRHYLDCCSRGDPRTLKAILHDDGFEKVDYRAVKQRIKRMKAKT
jgi:hypothetical protein